jgi:prolipoprotein diacylglyceryltransferase
VPYTFRLLAAAFQRPVVAARRKRRTKKRQHRRVGLWIVIGVIGRKSDGIRFYRDYVNPADLWSLAILQRPGIYGGFIGAILAALIYFRRHELPA